MPSFFGARKAPPAPAAVSSSPSPKSSRTTPATAEHDTSLELSLLLDAVGGILRLYGQHTFDTDAQSAEEIRALVHHWMLHATVGTPSPTGGDGEQPGGIGDRDWKGLLRFFGATRRAEAASVDRAQTNLRESIWAFIGGLHQLVIGDHEEGKLVQDHISRVKAAVENPDTEQLKRDTMAAVSVMEKLMESRRERQRQQFSHLADKLRDLGLELEDARRESTLDGLTRLPNRKAFDDYVKRSIELHSLMGKPASLLMIDVDNFKSVNDSLGHPAGDALLRQVTRALSRTILRKVDFVCRLGGDEFAVILQETGGDDAFVLGEKIRRSVSEIRMTPHDTEPMLEYTISVGVAQLELGDNALSWMLRADQALYDAKRSGRDQIAYLPTRASMLSVGASASPAPERLVRASASQ